MVRRTCIGYHGTKKEQAAEAARIEAAYQSWLAHNPGGTSLGYKLHAFNMSMQFTPMAGFAIEGAAEEAVAEGVATARGGLGPVLKGAAGVAKATAQIEAEGGAVVAREVTVETSAGRARIDLVYRDSSGRLVLGEAKNGPTARLNPNQAQVYEALKKGGGMLVGGNASAAQLPSTVGPIEVKIFKY